MCYYPSMKVVTDEKKIDDMLTRGVGEFIDPDGVFRAKLKNNPGKIIIKFGVDPTRPDIHLGHAVVLRKLRQFQEMGCKVVFLIGDYTGQIGDPTGKSKVRPAVNFQEIKINMETYLNQVDKILLKTSEVFDWTVNSDWFTSINDIGDPENKKFNWTSPDGQTLNDIDPNSTIGKALIFEKTRRNKELLSVTLSSFLWSLKHITHSRLITRDMFQNRIENNEELYLHEMMYPVLQGADSFALASIYGSCDLEVGGTDQTFNMLMGRDIMKFNKQEPQSVLSFKLLEGTDGKDKMSKSLDNYVGITDEPSDMYGKVMSIPDSSIGNYFELCTVAPLDEIAKIREDVKSGEVNPKDLKMNLAKQIVSIYHGEVEAQKAEESFTNTFQKKEIPDEMEEVKGEAGSLVSEVLVENKILASKGEWRRLVAGNAIHDLVKNSEVTDVDVKLTENLTLKIGKKKFLKILVN